MPTISVLVQVKLCVITFTSPEIMHMAKNIPPTTIPAINAEDVSIIVLFLPKVLADAITSFVCADICNPINFNRVTCCHLRNQPLYIVSASCLERLLHIISLLERLVALVQSNSCGENADLLHEAHTVISKLKEGAK